MQAEWWELARKHQVLPLDDRFAQRFAENAERHTGDRTLFTFWHGMGHLPSDVAPDLRSRSYTITAYVDIPTDGAEGVLIAHGDKTSGYSLYVQDGLLVHDLNIGGDPPTRAIHPADPDRANLHPWVPADVATVPTASAHC